MSSRRLQDTLESRVIWLMLAWGAGCATPDARPYLAAARMKEAREGRPLVETAGLRHTTLPDGRVVAEVLRLPDGSVLRHGVERESYASGAKRAVRHFERDAPVGEWTQWYEDGTPRSRYVHSDEPSPMTFFAPDGSISAEGPAVRGVRDGRWRFYASTGALEKEGDYVAGRREGEWVRYGPDGTPVARERFVADSRVE